MKMTHYWDCSGQGCDAATLQPWNEDKYISPPTYGPQDPADFGGPAYGEVMWLTGAASDALSELMGADDGCCGGDPNDGGVGGCGKCALVQNPDSLHPDWTAVVMKKNRCPPWSNGCGAGEPHFDVAAPGFDNLQWSTANVCGMRPGTGFQSQQQSAAVGSWWSECENTADCAHLCDELPSEYQRGCKLFASWGWKRGDPSSVKFKAVECPAEFVSHVGAQFGASGPTPSTQALVVTDSEEEEEGSTRRRKAAGAPRSPSAFCCWWAGDAGDACGSCTSRAPRKNWCAQSKDQCNSCSGGKAVWCDGAAPPSPAPMPLPPTPAPTEVPMPTPPPTQPTAMPTPAVTPAPSSAPTLAPSKPSMPSAWDGSSMKMTHYWDCSGQGCDAATLQPWDEDKYISPPGYGPQDPADFGGSVYGEVMWVTGAASDALSALMGNDDGCCGADPNDGGVGGCGKCALVQNPDSLHPEWTAVVMKKNRCPPWSNGCGAGEPHFDVAAPGFDNLQWSTANVCGIRQGTGFQNQQQSAAAGSWWSECANTADCAHLCDKLPSEYQGGCKLFASWGWKKGNPSGVKFKAVECPKEFVKHVGAQFGASGPMKA